MGPRGGGMAYANEQIIATSKVHIKYQEECCDSMWDPAPRNSWRSYPTPLNASLPLTGVGRAKGRAAKYLSLSNKC